jgi:hypothetical protein
LFNRYRASLGDLPLKGSYERDELCSERFLIAREGSIEVFYAPFDHINEKASLCLVRVTPGWTQMQVSFAEARLAMDQGDDEATILERAKFAASFSGSLRTNLVSMFDQIGTASHLGIASTDHLFHSEQSLLHPTSAIRYPVFKSGRNYSGSSPSILRHPLLVAYVEDVLGPELQAVSGALVVPLGKAAESGLHQLEAAGVIDGARILFGFPHPSGANAHRVRQFDGNRSDLASQVEHFFRRVHSH